MKKFREFFSSIAFSGLKPQQPGGAKPPRRGVLRWIYERLLAPIFFIGLEPASGAGTPQKGRIRRFFRRIFEPIVYAGLEPDEPEEAGEPAQPRHKSGIRERVEPLVELAIFAGLDKPAETPPKPKRPGFLRRLLDRFLSGGYTDDALYLSNRTWKQRIALGAAVGLPIAGVFGVMFYLTAKRQPPKPAPGDLTQAELASKTLPLPKDLKIDKNVDLEVKEINLDNRSTPPVVTGTLYNRSDKNFKTAEISFDLTDNNGSQVGAAEMTLHNVKPHAATTFRLQLSQRRTAFVLVRELRGL